jgi:hypothetical protein
MRASTVARLSAAFAFASAVSARPGAANCTARFFENTVDHFSGRIPPENGGAVTWKQRVLVAKVAGANAPELEAAVADNLPAVPAG